MTPRGETAPDRFAWRMADLEGEKMTDEAIASLVGQVGDLTMFGHGTGKVKVTAAYRYTDEMMGPGIWVEAERWVPDVPANPRPGVVQVARVRKLDTDGQPVGEWINIEGEWAWP